MKDRIKEFIISVLPDKCIMLEDDTSFKEDLGMKSMDFYYVLTMIEEEYDIEFEDRETQKIKTVGDLMVLCINKIA